jgi:hypothetical protein
MRRTCWRAPGNELNFTAKPTDPGTPASPAAEKTHPTKPMYQAGKRVSLDCWAVTAVAAIECGEGRGDASQRTNPSYAWKE